ncbi:ATPase domain-containing protein [Methanobacterium sp.]|uniref:ATPase domain-containing protein n=1 Tax=Methanobacterium sp. TaxID=2164 RepID=UPI003C74D4FF
MIRKSHIPKLDDFMNGGIPEGNSILFCAYPGVDCEAFGYEMLNGRLEDGDVGFIFTNVADPDSIIYEFNKYGWDLQTKVNKGQAFFVDGNSNFIGAPPQGKYIIKEYSQIEEIILNAIKDVPEGIGIINNLSMLIDYLGYDNTLNIINKWNKYAKEEKTTLIYIFTEWDYEKELIDKIKDAVDGVIQLKAIEERVIIGQGFMVAKASWTKPSDNMVLFFVLQPGGVKVYIPKLLVTGPYNAGKTTFVKAISTKSVSVDRQAFEEFPTTIAMDIGHLNYNGFFADIFGTPGQERFDMILDILSKESVGAFILVDSTAPQTFARAKEMISKCRAEAIPKVVIANKQDIKGALSTEEIRTQMKLSENIPIIPATVKDKKGTEDALNALLGLIYGD